MINLLLKIKNKIINLLQNSKNFIYHNMVVYMNKQYLINFFFIIIIGALLGYALLDYKVFGLSITKLIIYFIMYFVMFMLSSEKFLNFNNKYIRYLSKFLFLYLILILGFIFAVVFDISVFNTVYSDSDSEEENDEVEEDEIEVEGKNNNNNNNNNNVPTSSNNNNVPTSSNYTGEVNKEEKAKEYYDKIKSSNSGSMENEEYVNIPVKKDHLAKALEVASSNMASAVQTMLPTLGISGVMAKVATETIKTMPSNLSLPQQATRVGGLTVTAGIAAGTVLQMFKDKNSNEQYSEQIKNSIDRPDSPEGSSTFNSFINSPLDDSEIPLIALLNGLYILNRIELTLLFIIISILSKKYLNIYIKKIYLNIKTKYFPPVPSVKNGNNNKGEININEEKENNKGSNLENNLSRTDKFIIFILIILFLTLIIIKFLNIFFSLTLIRDIDDYVLVYLEFKKK